MNRKTAPRKRKTHRTSVQRSKRPFLLPFFKGITSYKSMKDRLSKNLCGKNPISLDKVRIIHYNITAIGVWRSLVSRMVRVHEAAGSNPATPTIYDPSAFVQSRRFLYEVRPFPTAVPLPPPHRIHPAYLLLGRFLSGIYHFIEISFAVLDLFISEQ